jgi:ABC-2 type transport system permease protein
MIANLVRKDFLLARKNIALLVGLCILSPFLIATLDRDSYQARAGASAFLYMAVLADLSFMQIVETEEEKDQKAAALLCAAPYSRKNYVIARYIGYLLFSLGCIAVYSISALLYSRLKTLSFGETSLLLLIGVILYGIYTPIAIKFGIAKAKIVSVVSIMTVCLMPTTIVRVLDIDMNSIFSFLQDPPVLISPVFFGAGIIIFILSMIISIRIFEKKEL